MLGRKNKQRKRKEKEKGKGEGEGNGQQRGKGRGKGFNYQGILFIYVNYLLCTIRHINNNCFFIMKMHQRYFTK